MSKQPRNHARDQARDQASGVRLVWSALSGTRQLIGRVMARIRRLLPARDRQPFAARYQPGLFVVESPAAARQIAAAATAAGLVLARIDGAAVTSKAEFLDTAGRALAFPDYFGHNWDAFAECIGDLDWLPGPGYVLILDHFDQFAATDPRSWSTALTILRRAAAGWASTDTPMYVFLRMSPQAVPNVPVAAGAVSSGEAGH